MQQPGYFTFGIQTATPPSIDMHAISVRGDEIYTIIDLLSNQHTRTVLITGAPGVGKSTLAAMVYGQLQSQPLEGQAFFRTFIWLRPGPRATWPDIVNALLNALKLPERSGSPISQRTDLRTLYEALRRPGQGALIVLDQCEELFDRALDTQNQTSPYATGIGLSSTVRFLEMLQQDLGESRFIVTCTKSPYGSDYHESPGIREHVVGGMTIVESIHLLQQRNISGLQQDLSTVWQRCAGHTFGLILFCALKNLSGLSLHYLLNSPAYQVLWSGDPTQNLIEAVVSFLNPVQMALMRTLCLFREAVPLLGILSVVTGEHMPITQESDNRLYEQELTNLLLLGLVEQAKRFDGQTGYQLHDLVSTYILGHYLEGEQRKSSYYATSSLGVADQPGPLRVNEEARKIALAAGHQRVAAYYQLVARQTFVPGSSPGHPGEIAPWLAMLEHLCLGWQWQSAYDQCCTLGLDEALLRWEMWHTLIRLYELMLSPGSLKRRDEGLICSSLGLVYGRLNDYEQSNAYYTSALAIQQDMGDTQNEAITLINQGELLRSQAHLEQAHQNFEQARALLQPETRPEATCILTHNMALLAQQEGQFQQSLAYFLQALQLARQVRDQEREAAILTNLGLLLCQQGRFQDGLALLLPALQMRHGQRDPGIQSLLVFLNKIEQRMGNSTFANLRQAAQASGKQEQVLQALASAS